MHRFIPAVTVISLLFISLSLHGQDSLSTAWTTPSPVPDKGGSATGNVGNNMVILSSGKLVLIYNETAPSGGIKLYQTTSDDDGTSWTTPTDFQATSGLIGSCCITMAVDQDDVIHAIFTARAPEVGLYYTNSSDGGTTWARAQRVSDSIRYKISYNFISTDASGRLHVFWHDGDTDDDSKPAEVWYTRSTDGGTSWQTPAMLSEDDGEHSGFPRADFGPTTSDTLLVAWRDSRAAGDDWDVYGAVTYDGGATWTEQLITGGSGRQWDPMVQIDKHGTIHLGIMEYPAGRLIEVFVWYMNSTDGGTTWSTPQIMREAYTVFPVFSYSAERDVLWYFLRIESPPGPKRSSDLGVRYSLDGGLSWSEIERLTDLGSGGTKFPAFATGTDGIPRIVYSLKDSLGNDKQYFQKRISAPGEAEPEEPEEPEGPETFFTVQCEPHTTSEYPRLVDLVDLANRYGILLTIQFAPQWAEMIMADSSKIAQIRTWQEQGHEIGAHHHGIYHPIWDGFTNYPQATITSAGKKLSDFKGNMDVFRSLVEPLGGDSLMLTLSGPGPTDPDSSVDWQPDFIYRTGGGRQPAAGFSSPRVIGMGNYEACQVDHFFLENQTSVNMMKGKYDNTAEKDVVGVVTHVFNFAADSNYVIDWFNFVQGTNRKTARQIIRDSGCVPDTTLTSVLTGEAPPAPLSLHLAQNYPNPFNPETMIRYTIPASSDGIPLVRLTIYNLHGQEVRTLVHDFQRAGEYTVQWDGRDEQGRVVASGIYLYQMRANGQVQTRRMVLMR